MWRALAGSSWKIHRAKLSTLDYYDYVRRYTVVKASGEARYYYFAPRYENFVIPPAAVHFDEFTLEDRYTMRRHVAGAERFYELLLAEVLLVEEETTVGVMVDILPGGQEREANFWLPVNRRFALVRHRGQRKTALRLAWAFDHWSVENLHAAALYMEKQALTLQGTFTLLAEAKGYEPLAVVDDFLLPPAAYHLNLVKEAPPLRPTPEDLYKYFPPSLAPAFEEALAPYLAPVGQAQEVALYPSSAVWQEAARAHGVEGDMPVATFWEEGAPEGPEAARREGRRAYLSQRLAWEPDE